jgi:uncharacterized protein YjbI with pentapeptide repeats
LARTKYVELLRQGAEVWNAWRRTRRLIRPNFRRADLCGADLRGADLSDADLEKANLSKTELYGADLSGAYLCGADLHGAEVTTGIIRGSEFLSGADFRGAQLDEANLSSAGLYKAEFGGSSLIRADLRGANLQEAKLTQANLSKADLRKANLFRANLTGAYLIGANLSEADLLEANLHWANLSHATLHGTDLQWTNFIETTLLGADLTGCRIYGISAWGLKVSVGTKQQDLVITAQNEPTVTADDIEVAQFLHLLIHNEKMRKVIDTITSKVVLILGRFSEERKIILDAIRNRLRNRNLLPVIFDFPIPASRDVSETVRVLAGLARFVIADITDATQLRAELHTIIPEFASLPVQTILRRGDPEFVSLSHLKKFPWVLPSFEYDSVDHLLINLDKSVVGPAETKLLELRGTTPA